MATQAPENTVALCSAIIGIWQHRNIKKLLNLLFVFKNKDEKLRNGN